jgi:hypothetical protein
MIIAQKRNVELDGRSLSLDFALPESAAERVRALGASLQDKYVLQVILSGIAVTPAGLAKGADYRLYINLPTDANTRLPHEEFYVGGINTFALSDPKHKGHGNSVRFDLGQLATALAKRNLWRSDRVSLSLVTDNGDEPTPLITIEVVQLDLSDR